MSCCDAARSSSQSTVTLSPPKLTRKVSLVGDSSVGKTSLLNRYLSKDFINVQATVGAAFAQKRLVYTFQKDGHYEDREVQCQFWDTAGQEKYHSLAPMYLRKSDICLVAFSLVDVTTFEHVSSWIQTVNDICPDAMIILVGCKADLLKPDRNVTIDSAFVNAKYPRHEYMTTSAKTGMGVDELFNTISYKLLI